MCSAAHEKHGPLVAGQNTSNPDAFSNLTAKRREHVGKLHCLGAGLGIGERETGHVNGESPKRRLSSEGRSTN